MLEVQLLKQYCPLLIQDFTGNSDMNTVVKHVLSEPFGARQVRLTPTTYNNHKSLRWELYGWYSEYSTSDNVDTRVEVL